MFGMFKPASLSSVTAEKVFKRRGLVKRVDVSYNEKLKFQISIEKKNSEKIYLKLNFWRHDIEKNVVPQN